MGMLTSDPLGFEEDFQTTDELYIGYLTHLLLKAAFSLKASKEKKKEEHFIKISTLQDILNIRF